MQLLGSLADMFFQTLAVLTVCSALGTRSSQRCRPSFCRDEPECCPGRNASACCEPSEDGAYGHVATVTRKLSGVLIMLLLFALGYSVQRVLCSRSRQLSPDDGGRPAVAASRELLMESSTPDSLTDGGTMAYLPTYDQCKHLPTYEETVGYGQAHSSLMLQDDLNGFLLILMNISPIPDGRSRINQ
ncbi:uncharacterized membrane protein C3orf80 homolog [Syngnathus acus]|uniref:uncharacterized membrane protein C3orf80 homolog n=1 Tax=Syngnathus acus TaxID=161584 RepID=UPI001885F9B7|nr:uncharacterized membrane protein C3orf80 homolog [Syngnathus acus]